MVDGDAPSTNILYNMLDNDIENKEQKIQKKRGRKKGSPYKKPRMYFTQKTEDAIVEYNKTSDPEQRNIIYNEKIKYSFEKLVENIFNTFKFSYCDDLPVNMQHEVISNLIENIHKFKSCKGKAFSYFSIIAKNYLIAINNKNYKNAKIHVNVSETPEEDSVCMQAEDKYYSDVENRELIDLIINYWDKNIEEIFTNKKELSIAYAVIELLRNCDRIENFSKKMLYLYIREISDSKTQQITKVLTKMRSHQKALTQSYYDSGTF